MSMNINRRQDLSYLFSGLNKNSSSYGMTSMLSDYASIKNGSYGKLMKAYYSENVKGSVKNAAKQTLVTKNKSVVTKEENKALTKMKSTTDALKNSADALLDSGKKSLFVEKDIVSKDKDGKETTVKGYDTEAIYKAVNNFVTDYNAALKAGKDVANSSVTSRINSMTSNTQAYSKSLEKIGITINEDNTLSINKDTFMKTDMSKVKSLFQGTGSYGYQASAQASRVNYAADSAVAKASTYSATGNYNNYNTGDLFNNFF